MLKRSRPTVRVLVFVLGVLLAACAQLAAANVEKIIFVVPSLPDGDLRSYPHSPLSNVAPEGASENAAAAAAITSLTPSKPRTTAFVPFTKELAEEGQSRVSRTPVELDGLSVGQRYEVRVCWLASHPMTFDFSLDTRSPLRTHTGRQNADVKQSYVLDILSSPDYVLLPSSELSPTNTSAQLPVKIPVDVILDPYLLNAIPRSLLPTIAYLLLLVMPLAWCLSGFADSVLKAFARGQEQPQLPAGEKHENGKHEADMDSDKKKTK